MALTQVPPALLTSTTGTGSTVVLSASPTFTGTVTTPGVTFSDASSQTAAASPYVLKNRIINGAMVIDQRNAGAAVTAANSFPVDRFKMNNTTDGTFSAQQSSTVPSSGGFVNSVLVTVTSADTSLTTTQRLALQQTIEGYNIADLGWGTASAKTVTLSFWVRSSLTGTFSGSLRNSAADRSYPYTYTISVANTWEQKSVTIAGDTSGTWLTTNGEGIMLFFSLGVGPSLLGTAGAWAGAGYWGATGETSVVGTNGATWYVTGVQLEIGSTATPFERRLYNQELANCQRYYYKWINNTGSSKYNITMQAYNTTSAYGKLFDLPVTMRSQPTATASGTFTGISAGGNLTTAFSGKTIDSSTAQTIATGGWTGSSGLVAGNCTILEVTNNAYIEVSAEL